MANACDPELSLDKFGDLISLYKRDPTTGSQTEELLTAQQVAKCVKFYELQPMVKNHLPYAQAQPFEGEVTGLKVNLIGGATGAGKTSLIHIMAGGMETPPKSSSDTKCPAVYLFDLDVEGGEKYAILDTAGLCDTAATANANVGMQELLINAVAATVQMYELQIVSFLMCVDMAGRLPGDFGKVWPQMQVALGGDRLAPLCHFVVTKANGDSKINKAKLQQLPDEEFYKELVHSPLKWPVVHAGRENLDGIQMVLKPMSTTASGVGGASVNADAQSLATKKEIADKLEAKIASLRDEQRRVSDDAASSARHIQRMQEEINNAYEELASTGNCRESEKARLRGIIDEKNRELREIQSRHQHGLSTVQQTESELNTWNDKFQEEMEAIRKMHGFGAFFKNLVGGTVCAVTGSYSRKRPLDSLS